MAAVINLARAVAVVWLLLLLDNCTATMGRKLVELRAATQAGGRGTRLGSTAGRGHLRDHRAFHPSGSAGRDDRGIDRPGDHVPRLGVGGTGCPRADRDSHPYRHGVLCVRPDLALDAVVRGVCDLPARAPVRDRRPRLCRTYRAARAYYFDCAPELVPYLASVPPPQRLVIQALRADSGRPSGPSPEWLASLQRSWPASRLACSPPSPMLTPGSPGSSQAGSWASPSWWR